MGQSPTPERPANGGLVNTVAKIAPWAAMAAMAAFWRHGVGRRRSEPYPPVSRTPAAYEAAEPGRGRQANAPWLIPPLGWKDIAWRTYNEYGRARLPALAGGVTFYLLLASFPAAAAFISLYGLFFDVGAVEQHFLRLSTLFPSDAVNLIGAQMIRVAGQNHGTLGAAFAVSAVVSIWSANAGMKALFDGLNVAYNEVEKRPFLPRTVLTYAASLATIAFAVTIAAVSLAAPAVVHDLGLRHLAAWWEPARWLFLLSLVSLALGLLYRLGPSRAPPRWRWLVFGAVFAAGAWLAGSFGFSWYLDRFTHLGVTYGSLGAVIGFMLWMWLSVMIVLMGAELNSEIEHQTACDTTAGPAKPIGRRGAVMADHVGAAFTTSPREAAQIARAFMDRQIRTVADAFRRLARL